MNSGWGLLHVVELDMGLQEMLWVEWSGWDGAVATCRVQAAKGLLHYIVLDHHGRCWKVSRNGAVVISLDSPDSHLVQETSP